jgi:hypothetical protein
VASAALEQRSLFVPLFGRATKLSKMMQHDERLRAAAHAIYNTLSDTSDLAGAVRRGGAAPIQSV